LFALFVLLGVPGTVKKLEIDTAHFKGNFPHSCSVEGAFVPKDLNPVIALGWHQLLPRSLLQADKIHHFDVEPNEQNFVVTHIKLCIYPDGGVSRLRVWGVPALNAKY
jgi:allantoicase